MRLLITLFTLAFVQLFFNMAHASPTAPVTASQPKVEKKHARDDERRKRRPLKATTKKTRTASAQKPESTTKKSRAVSAQKPESGKKSKAVTASSKKTKSAPASRRLSKAYGHQRNGKKTAVVVSRQPDSPLKLSKAHRARYQKARETAMNKLMGQLGKPYQWGGTSPRTGFDCSGLVWYAYKDLVKFKIPRTANEMYHLRDAAQVQRASLEKGDLVFFRINNRGAADHVGVYLGNGKFIQSPRSGKDIQISALSEEYWQSHYVGARRVMTPKTMR